MSRFSRASAGLGTASRPRTAARRARLVTTLLAAVLVAPWAAAAPAQAAGADPDPVGPAWTPDDAVRAIVSDGDRVYVGGKFTGGVAALDATDGSLLWTADLDDAVWALGLTDDGHLIAGGAFKHADGVKHRKLASLRVSDGVSEPKWKAAAGGKVRDLVVVGDTVYFGGTFNKHGGFEQQSLGAVNATTGKLDTSFDAATDGSVHSMATDGSRLYFGGKFSTVDGQPRDTLASVTLSDHSLDGWAPTRICSRCNVQWDITVEGGTLYGVGRNAGAVHATDTTTGLVDWVQRTNGDAQAVTVAGGLVWAGGHFSKINGGGDRKLLAAFDPATGDLQGFNTRFKKSWPGIWALHGDANHLYVGGFFDAAGPLPNRYPYLAMFGLL